jgi:transcriptional regulator GlxA family with amidase domain
MTEQRIERAKKVLAETDLPKAEVALRAGFASQSHHDDLT